MSTSKIFGGQDWRPNMRALRYFACVAEEKSMSKAAGRMRIAQPALSRQIAALEEEIGLKLFERVPRGVELTEGGELLLDRVYGVFAQLAQAHRDVTLSVAVPRGTVLVGMPPTPGEFIIPPLLRRMRDAYPDIELRFVEGFSRELERSLVNNEISLAVMHDPPDRSDLHVRELLRESLHLIGTPGKFDKDSYSLAEAARFPLIMPSRPNSLRVLVDRAASVSGVELNVVQRVDGVWHLKALLRDEHGYSLLTYGAVLTEMLQGTLEARTVERPSIEWRLCVASRADQSRKMAVALVEEAICEIVGDLVVRRLWR